MTAFPEGYVADGAYAKARWPAEIEKLRIAALHGGAPNLHCVSGAKNTLTVCAPEYGVPTKMGYWF
jgi:hypothetical protein